MRVGSPAVSFAAACICTLAGCFNDDVDTSTVEEASTFHNGQNLNGQNLNGQNLNGESELGNFIEWTSYRDATLASQALKNLRLDGSELVGKVDHNEVRGTALVGAMLDAQSDTGLDLDLRIAAVFAPGGNQDPTTWRYMVEYRETNDAWIPICLNGTTAVPSIPIDGYWNLDQGEPGDGSKIKAGTKLTFACEQVGALGKCIEAGYRPWLDVDNKSLDRFHQTCVRLLRADYCGDSVSHTVDGSLVNIYDDLGIQVDTEDWAAEAEWDRNGARCISPDATNPLLANAACFDDLVDDDCATSFDHRRTLLISERP